MDDLVEAYNSGFCALIEGQREVVASRSLEKQNINTGILNDCSDETGGKPSMSHTRVSVVRWVVY